VVDGNSGVVVNQPSSGSRIGVSDKAVDQDTNPEFDAATIELDSGVYAKYDLASDAGDNEYAGWDIRGSVGWDNIKDNPEDTIWKQGSATGLVSGTIEHRTPKLPRVRDRRRP